MIKLIISIYLMIYITHLGPITLVCIIRLIVYS